MYESLLILGAGLVLLGAGAIIALLGVGIGARAAGGLALRQRRGLFGHHLEAEEEAEIEYPTVMSARDMARASGEERPEEVMPQSGEDAPFRPLEETDIT